MLQQNVTTLFVISLGCLKTVLQHNVTTLFVISLGCLRPVLQQNLATLFVVILGCLWLECDYPVCYFSGLPQASAAAECDYPVYFSGLPEASAAAECDYSENSLCCLKTALQQNLTTPFVIILGCLWPERDYPVCYFSGLPQASVAAACDYPVCYFSGLPEASAAAECDYLVC